jgi:hypothetical protein
MSGRMLSHYRRLRRMRRLLHHIDISLQSDSPHVLVSRCTSPLHPINSPHRTMRNIAHAERNLRRNINKRRRYNNKAIHTLFEMCWYLLHVGVVMHKTSGVVTLPSRAEKTLRPSRNDFPLFLLGLPHVVTVAGKFIIFRSHARCLSRWKASISTDMLHSTVNTCQPVHSGNSR